MITYCYPRSPRHANKLAQVCVTSASNTLRRPGHQKSRQPNSPVSSRTLFPNAYHMLLCPSYPFSNVPQSFDRMPQRDQCVQSIHIPNVLDLVKSTTLGFNIVTAAIVHCLAIKCGDLAHLPTATSLLTCYSKAGKFCSSLTFFGEIWGKDIIFWNSMITACIENDRFGLAVDFFAKMIVEGIGFDSTTLLLAVSALSRMNKLKQGQNIHSLSLKSGVLLDSNLCNALIDMYAKGSELSDAERVFAQIELKDIVSWNSIMGGCIYNNHLEKALWYFREMTSFGQRPDNVTLSCAIAASASMGERNVGEVIHALGLKLGYDDRLHTSVGNSLISLYSKCGDTRAAEIVFRGMIRKDVVSWNAMIDGFASSEMVFEAFDLLSEMQLMATVQPDAVTIVSLTSHCAKLMLLKEARTIHGYTVRRHMKSDLLVTNSLIDMYSKCKSMMEAQLLFNGIQEKDLVSWNMMISGYSKNGHSKEAHELFKELLRWCPRCSLSTVLAVLPSCSSPEALQFGKSIHCWQLKEGFSYNIFVLNSLMHMYIYCGDVVAAFSILLSNSFVPDVASWNTVIAGCTQNCHFGKVLQTFKAMRREPNVNHDSVTVVNVVSACGNLGLVSEGKSLHGLALKTSMGLDTRVQNALITMYGRCGDIDSARLVFGLSSNYNLCSWNCMISAFTQNKDGRRAIELFRCLDFEPNEITIVSVLAACTQIGIMGHGKQIHGYVYRTGFQKNSFICAALSDMYSSCGRLDIAVQVFRNSQEKTVAAWSSMISAFGYHGNGRKAIDFFHEMLRSGLRATKSTFVSLLSACSHSGLVDEGICYYNSMLEEYGVEPASDHQVCVVDMLGRSGRLEEAFDFIKRAQTAPEPGVWGALLSACNYHGDIGMGKEIAELLFELEPENTGYYISLSNMHVAAGRWEEAVDLRNIVQDKQLKKPTGYSLIDVGMR